MCTPSLPSIDAALEPDTADKFIYFLAIPDGGGAHAFAKTKAEHDENRRKYGYIQ
jgi:cell division protein YceG involved in septum cleavage